MKTIYKIFLINLLLGTFGLLLLSNCSTSIHVTQQMYPGEPKSKEETSMLFISAPLSLVSVDGKKKSFNLMTYELIQVLPGKHEIELIYRNSVKIAYDNYYEYTAPVKLTYDTKPGQIYFVRWSKDNIPDYAIKNWTKLDFDYKYRGIFDLIVLGLTFKSTQVGIWKAENSMPTKIVFPEQNIQIDIDFARNIITVSENEKVRIYKKFAVGDPIISNDLNHIAFSAKKEDKWYVVIDGVENGPYEKILKNTPVFSKNSKRVLYAGFANNKWYVIVDGKELGSYNEFSTGTPMFSLDSKHVYYGARKGKKWFAVKDGIEAGPYDDLGADFPSLSSDETQYAYGIRNDEKWAFVINGKQSEYYDLIFKPTFSANNRLVYNVKIGNKFYSVEDGKKTGPFDGIGKLSPVFNLDGSHIVYSIMKGKQWIVLDNWETKGTYDGILKRTPIFSADGSRLSYGALINKKWYIITNDKKSPPYDGILQGTPIFSPFGNRLVYSFCIGKSWFVKDEGKMYGPFDGIRRGTPVFSADGKRMAFGAVKNYKWFVVVDGKESDKYKKIQGIHFEAKDDGFSFDIEVFENRKWVPMSY